MSDTISRQAAIDAIYERCAGEHWEDILRSIPPADVRPVVRGQWIDYDDDYGALCCSVCEKDTQEDTRWPFCPNCGADMRGTQDE